MKPFVLLIMMTISLAVMATPTGKRIESITFEWIKENMELVHDCCVQIWESEKIRCKVDKYSHKILACRSIDPIG